MSKKSNRLIAVMTGSLLSSFANIASADSDAIIDLYVSFSPAAAQNNGGANNVKAGLMNSVSFLNEVNERSQTGLRFNPVAIEEINFTWDGVPYSHGGILINGPFDYRGRKAELGADMGVLYADSHTGGWSMDNWDDAFITYFGSTLAHEIGHAYGGGHGVGPGDAPKPYGLGYSFTGTDNIQYATVIAGGYLPGVEAPVYSNPNIQWAGVPAGTNERNNARAITENRYRKVNNGQLNPNRDWTEKWVIVNRASGQAIYAPDSQAGSVLFHEVDNGQRKYQWQFHANWWNWNESWVYNPSTQKYITAPANATYGANVIQDTGAGLNRQKFVVDSQDNGFVQLRTTDNWLLSTNWLNWYYTPETGWFLTSPVILLPEINSSFHQYELRKVIE